jgi:hypothetical protein
MHSDVVLYWLFANGILYNNDGDWMVGHWEDTPINMPVGIEIYLNHLNREWHDDLGDLTNGEKQIIANSEKFVAHNPLPIHPAHTGTEKLLQYDRTHPSTKYLVVAMFCVLLVIANLAMMVFSLEQGNGWWILNVFGALGGIVATVGLADVYTKSLWTHELKG